MTLDELEPAALIALLTDASTPLHILTFAAEHAGDCPADYHPQVERILLKLQKHPAKVVREGAIYGLMKLKGAGDMGDFIVFRAGDDSIRGHIPSEPAKLDTPYREWALNVEDAAAMWTEAHYDDIGRPPEVECVVIDPKGVGWRVKVKYELLPNFSPSDKEPLP